MKSSIAVPIEVRNGLVVAHARVNDRDALLIIDTGSGVSVIDTAFAREAAINESGMRAEVKGTGGASVRLGTARSLWVGDANLRNVAVAAVPLEALRAAAGSDIRGTLGFDLFDQYVVDIDYAAHTMTLSEPTTFAYAGSGTVLPLSMSHRVPALAASLVTRKKGTVPVQLHLDLGSSGYAVRLASPFVLANDLEHDTTTVAGLFGTGVGGIIEGALLRMPALILGSITVLRPSTALSHETEGAFGTSAEADGTIGAPVWSRMRVIVDYSRSRVILEPRGDLARPDSVTTTGVSVVEELSPRRALRVSFVVKGSAGADAGVAAGDELLQIGTREATAMSVSDVGTALRTANAPITLDVMRNGSRHAMKLVPKQIF